MAANSRDLQLIELKDMISQLNTTIKTLNETIAKQQAENDSLKAELAWFRHKLFGSSSERGKIGIEGQLSLFDDLAGEDEKPAELIEPEVVLEGKKTRKRKPTLKEQFKGIPTRKVVVDTLSDEDLFTVRHADGADRNGSDPQ